MRKRGNYHAHARRTGRARRLYGLVSYGGEPRPWPVPARSLAISAFSSPTTGSRLPGREEAGRKSIFRPNGALQRVLAAVRSHAARAAQQQAIRGATNTVGSAVARPAAF